MTSDVQRLQHENEQLRVQLGQQNVKFTPQLADNTVSSTLIAQKVFYDYK